VELHLLPVEKDAPRGGFGDTPLNTFISVDLPAPFSPTNACISFSRTSRLTLFSALTPGNVFVMPRISNKLTI